MTNKEEKPVDFTAYTRAMLDEQAQKVVLVKSQTGGVADCCEKTAVGSSHYYQSLFTKKPLLQISKLRLSLQ